MDKLNILILHRMGDPKYWRIAVQELEFMLPQNAPQHNYIVHSADIPLPAFIKDIDFHSIILGPTFLCSRYNNKLLAQVKQKYDFIRTSSAFKIALPQDDYDCSSVLDTWMVSWNIDLVYTVCPNGWDVLYPEFIKRGRIKLGYTGYIANRWIDLWASPKPFDKREIDVSYRAKKLPPNFGRIGHIKGTIGEIFKSKVSELSLKLDISTDENDVIVGDTWHSFVENSKFCLTTNSGSSILDREGKIRKKVNRYLHKHPNASFEEVEKECFPNEDGIYEFTAISPRNIEAALAKTVQIATRGSYNGIMEPERHYIPFETDGSNYKYVIEIMRNVDAVTRIAVSCKEAFLSVDALRSSHHTKIMIDEIIEGISRKKIEGTLHSIMEKYCERFKHEVTDNENDYWNKKNSIINTKLGKIKNEIVKIKKRIYY